MLKRLLKMNAFFLVSLIFLSASALAADISFDLPDSSYVTPGGYPVYQDSMGWGVTISYTTNWNQNVCDWYLYLNGNKIDENHGCHGNGDTSYFFDVDKLSPGTHTLKFEMKGWHNIPIPIPYTYSESTKFYVNDAPTAVIGVNPGSTVDEGTVVTLIGSDSTDSDGSIQEYRWDLDGDGTYDTTGSVITHVYNTPGTYEVLLRVKDNYDAIDKEYATIKVNEVVEPVNKLPIASITADPATIDEGGIVLFDGSGSSDPDGYITSYRWDFGDGSEVVTGVVTTSHKYITPRTYTASLTVKDDYGALDSATIEITVNDVVQPPQNEKPVAVISASLLQGEGPLTVTFDGSGSHDSDGSIVDYTWTFGNGDSGEGETVTYTYSEPTVTTTYTAELTVKDNEEATGSATVSITVSPSGGNGNGNVAPVVEITSHNDYTEYPQGTTLIVVADASDSTDYIKAYAWKLDGATYESGENGFGTSFTKSYTFPAALLTVGEHTIVFEVTDNHGVTNSDSITIMITGSGNGNQAPSADFDYTVGTLTAAFDAGDSYDPDGYITSYAWTFGDGETGNGEVVSHAYETDGEYTVTLIVQDNKGATGTTSQTIYLAGLSNYPPLARFSPTNSSMYDYQFVDTSFDPDGSIEYREWFFELELEEETLFEGEIFEWEIGEDNYTLALISITESGDNFYAHFQVTKNSTDMEEVIIREEDIGSLFIDEDGRAEVGIYVTEILGLGSSATFIVGEGYLSEPTPKVTYPDYGDYTVILKVKDNEAAENSTLRIISVSPPNELPTVDAGYDMTVIRNTTVNFTITASDPDGEIAKYEWDFDGDGEFDFENKTGGNASYNYTELGIFAALVRVTDNDGDTRNDTIYVTVTLPGNKFPTANAGLDQTVDLNTIVGLVGTGTDADGYITLYEWDFDADGDYDWSSLSTGVTSHLYDIGGTYYAKLRVTDNEGAHAYDTIIITVQGPSVSSRIETITYDFRLHALDVVRVYRYDSITALTSYTLRVTNLVSDNRTFLVREFIPKSFAADIDYITFSEDPDIIYNRDPEMGWNISLEGFDTWETTLTFHKYIDYGNFTENMSNPGITEYKITEQGEIIEEELQPEGMDITGLAFGVLSSPWFGLLVLVVLIALSVAFWKKEEVIRLWKKMKARLQ